MMQKNRIWLVAGGLLLGVALVWAFAGGFSAGVPVDVAEATKGPIEEFVDERGITRLPKTYLITMPYNGRVTSITLTEGDAVEKENPEKPVALIVPEDLKLTVDEARAVVDRLDAAMKENLSSELEKLAMEQAVEFVKSMEKTVEAARARLTSGKKKLDYAKSNLVRVMGLHRTDSVSDDELERAELEKVVSEVDYTQDQLVLAMAESLDAATKVMPRMVDQFVKDKTLGDAVLRKQRAEALARLEQAELNRTRGTILSPIDGVVLERFVSDERSLAADTPLLELGRLEELEIEADVLSLDVVRVEEDDTVEIYGPAIGPKPVRGTVAKIYPAGFTKISSLGVEQQRVKVIIHFNQEDLRRLRTERHLEVGYRVRVRIITDRKTDALVIPRSALFRGDGGTWQVYAVRNGRAQIETVRVGMINDERAEVIAGLEPGDRVVRAPDSNLADGEHVKAEETKEEPPAEEAPSQAPEAAG